MSGSKETESKSSSEFVEAYDKLLERARAAIAEFKEETGDALHRAIDQAKEKAVELGEITREEAENVTEYLKRDLSDAARAIDTERRELADWLRLDLLRVENSLMETFSELVERARVEFKHFSKGVAQFGDWHTGEITSIGTLECKHCGEQLHFHATSHIPPCPKCHKTTFKRP